MKKFFLLFQLMVKLESVHPWKDWVAASTTGDMDRPGWLEMNE